MIDDTPVALQWVEATTARATSSAFGRIVSGVVWTDASIKGFNLGEYDPDQIALKTEGIPILRNHDPGLPVGKVLAAKAFTSPEGRRFVAAIFGLYTAETQVNFWTLGLDAKAQPT